jgi:hypothetical protein
MAAPFVVVAGSEISHARRGRGEKPAAHGGDATSLELCNVKRLE